MSRALVIAKSSWADPNQRCAAVTAALAIVVCPDRVKISRWIDGSIQVRFESLHVNLPRTPRAGMLIFSIISSVVDRNGSRHYFQFKDLAESYDDHRQNMKCMKFLNSYCDMHLERTAMAAVLGLAWAYLQRRDISESFAVGGDDGGLHFKCDELGIGIRVKSDVIVGARYPGLH